MDSIKTVLHEARKQLKNLSDSPALDAELLLAHCLQKNRSYLHTWPENTLTNEQQVCFQAFLKKRLSDYPVAYLLGSKAFWTLDLIVTPDVLIPRPETELLVKTALEKIKNIKKAKILDLGTGSGAIALALASERPDAEIIATDASVNALLIAKKNAKKYKLSGNIEFIESNWFTNIVDKNFDLIVSNPPYIAENDPHLLATIRYEPQQALVAKNINSGDGMKDIKAIIKQSKNHLKENGWLMIEHGYQQSLDVQSLFKKYQFKHYQTVKDLSGNNRLTISQLTL